MLRPGTKLCFAGKERATISLILLLGIWLSGYSCCLGQSSTASPDTIRCASCGLSNQGREPKGFDQGRVQFLVTPRPVVFDGHSFEAGIIARVLATSPLIVEIVDSDFRWFDERGKKVPAAHEPYEPDTCGIRRYDNVDEKSKTVLSRLQFNDFVTARWFFAGEKSAPFNPLASKIVISDIRKISQPVPYFRNVGGKDICANRTGILIVYRSRGDQLVIVYNDGSLYYRGVRFKSFHHQKLTSEEVDQLLTAFAKADFEALPGGMPSLDKPADPAITLLCSRFQEVPVNGRCAEVPNPTLGAIESEGHVRNLLSADL